MKRLVIILLVLPMLARAQGQLSLYQMRSSVPQANLINPAFSPDAKFNLGLPLISSAYVSFGAPMSYNDVFVSGTDDSLRLNSARILEKLDINNKIEIDADVALLFAGLRTNIGYFTISYVSRVDGSMSIPGNLVEFVLKGPDDPDGTTSLRINNLDLRSSWFNELGVGFSRKITRELTVGGRLKYLQGIANVSVENLNGTLSSNIDSIAVQIEPWALRTAGLENLENLSSDVFLFSNGNHGWALDLGVTYQVLDNLLLSGSVADLGSISWKEKTKSFVFDGVNYAFKGFDLIKVIDDETTDLVQMELDSLEEKFTPEEIEDLPYSTPLTGKFYLGGTYTLAEKHDVGLVFAGEMFKGRLSPAIGITYNIRLVHWLNAGLNLGYRNKTFSNIGAGLSARLGPVQLYALADTMEGILFQSVNAEAVSFRLGLNIMTGRAN